MPSRPYRPYRAMDALIWFGLIAVSMMLPRYALERRPPWWILGIAGACAMGSAYGFLQSAWPFGVVEAIWAIVAAARWRQYRRSARAPSPADGSPRQGQ